MRSSSSRPGRGVVGFAASTSPTLNQPQIIQILGFENVILTLYIVYHTSWHGPSLSRR